MLTFGYSSVTGGEGAEPVLIFVSRPIQLTPREGLPSQKLESIEYRGGDRRFWLQIRLEQSFSAAVRDGRRFIITLWLGYTYLWIDRCCMSELSEKQKLWQIADMDD